MFLLSDTVAFKSIPSTDSFVYPVSSADWMWIAVRPLLTVILQQVGCSNHGGKGGTVNKAVFFSDNDCMEH